MEAQIQKVSPIAVAVRFGLLVAVITILIDFVVRISNVSFMIYGAVSVVLALVVSVVGVVFAHRAFRRGNEGVMSYGQGVVIAAVMLLISGVIASVFNYVYVNYVDPEFVDHMKEGLTAFMERSRVPDEQIAQSVAKFEEMRPPLGTGLLKGVMNGLGWGAVLGIIISAFTKRKPADFE
jgi:TM2 domain-containing membrane protein YozV